MDRIADRHPIYDRKADSAREYWLRALSANCEDAVISTDHSSEAQGAAGGPIALTISDMAFERLTKLTAGSSFLLYVTLLAAVKVCLYKYSRSKVITVGGSPRNVEGGPLYPPHALAIVDKIDGGISFRTLLFNIKETVAEAYQYQDYPLRDFVNDLGVGEERQFRPQVLLAVKDFHGDIPPLRSDIMLKFERDASEVHGIVDFDYKLFSPDFIQRFISDVQNILSLALEDTNISINELSELTPAESQQLLLEWNNTSRPFPENYCLHDLFVFQVSNTPEAVAVIYDDKHLTYLELNRRANRLAHYLIINGVRPEGRVGLCMERSLEMVVGVLGCMKAGGAYVPLDPSYPPARLSYMLNDAQITILLTQQHLREHLTLADVRVVCFDEVWERISKEREVEPEGGAVAENLSYVIYTSGSTGRPKGVMIAHKGLCNLVEAQKEAFRIGDQSHVLQFSSLSFDASVSEIFSALTSGGSLHLHRRESLMPGAELSRVLREGQITTVTLPPTVLAAQEQEGSVHLQTLIAAGEACTAEIVERWARGRRFLDAYGPTEATVCASIGECEGGGNRKPTIGRPIANTRLYILDREIEPVPVGVQGELYIAGVGLARGYWGKPELTAERFIPHLFSSGGGERLYRTGDMVRYLSDGNIEYIGRADEQVKLRGYRVELREIEVRLGEHAAVEEAVVMAREEEGKKRLVGYVVMKDGEEGRVSELRAYLKERLPEYMVPGTYVRLERLPLTPNGKVDKLGLPRPGIMESELEEGYQGRLTNDLTNKKTTFIPPRDFIESQLTQIWEELFNLHPIGVVDSFFELGGHSLVAVSLRFRIEKLFGVSLPIQTLFQSDTIEQLAAILRCQRRFISRPALVPVQSRGARKPFFCVHPGGGTVLCYYYLAYFLGLDQPFYAFQSYGIDEDSMPLDRIEHMAGAYIEDLRTIQPHGPYLLGGWSLGALIAFEMAQQLLASGEEVALLALFDTIFESAEEGPEIVVEEMRAEEDPQTAVEKVKAKRENAIVENGEATGRQEVSDAFLEEFFLEGRNIHIPPSVRKLPAKDQMSYLIELGKKHKVLPPDYELSRSLRIAEVWNNNVEASFTYRMRPYNGKATYFLANEENHYEIENVKKTQRRFASEVECYEVMGTHKTLMRKKNAKVLAECMNRILSNL